MEEDRKSVPDNKSEVVVQSGLNIITPLLIGLAVALGMWLGYSWDDGRPIPGRSTSDSSLDLIFQYIENEYVDTVDEEGLKEESINMVLNTLDPYSTYIPSRMLKHVNEPLEGKFEGIGIEFLKLKDTVTVISVIPGGPSDKAGLLTGDQIISVDGETIAGAGLDNASIISRLKGPRGTLVDVVISRYGVDSLLHIQIERDKIRIKSVETAFMLDQDKGYIKLNKFSALTARETNESILKLKEMGMEKLVLDLRDNPGGYLDAAVSVADEFLKSGKTITYTEGINQKKEEYSSSSYGEFEDGPLVILIDEGSASASEIVSGAVQDYDRGYVIGRRSFGKGLVQEQYRLPDGAALRLTVARYHTPSGRCIQKDYEEGGHDREIRDRIANGELFSKDSIKQDLSERFETESGRIVYGGGGIVPDIFIPADSLQNLSCLSALNARGNLTSIALDLAAQFRDEIEAMKTAAKFSNEFKFTATHNKFIQKRINELGLEIDNDCLSSDGVMLQQLKAVAGRQVFGNEAFYRVILSDDQEISKSIEVLSPMDNRLSSLPNLESEERS